MRSDFEDLKRFAIADILSASGRRKTTETIDKHINNIIDIALLKGQLSQQAKIDELQKRVDAAQDALTELKEKSEALHYRWNILSDTVALAEAEMIDMCVKELEQALEGGEA